MPMPPFFRLSTGLLLLLVVLAAGCSGKTPEKKLIGKWLGAPHVQEDVDQAVDAAAQGQKVNPLARGAVRFLGQKLADATMSIELDLRANGRAFFRGNTEVIGLASDSDGTWQVSPMDSDLLKVSLGTDTTQLQGQILFRDDDEFTLKLDAPATPAPEAKTKDEGKNQKPRPQSIVFKRDKY
jgi:hypothetical protein